jgi:hypothetical protein
MADRCFGMAPLILQTQNCYLPFHTLDFFHLPLKFLPAKTAE